jgi:hypothetical protein
VGIVIKKMIKIKSKFNNKRRKTILYKNIFVFLSTRADSDQTQSALINNPVATYSDTQHRSSLPVTINLNPGDGSQSGNLPASVTIPLG